MWLTLIEPTKAVCSQSLHETHINVGVEVLHEHVALDCDETGKLIQIMIEQVLANLWRQIGLSVVQKGSGIVLQRAFAASLIVHKKRLTIAKHDVARLEIAIE